MADTADNTPKKKRRLRQAPTIREQAIANSQKAEKKTKKASSTDQSAKNAFIRGFFAPLRLIGRVLRPIFRILVPKYFRNSWKELRLVSWPKGKESIRLTTAVIIFSIIFGVIVAILDFVFERLFREILLK